MAEQQIRLKFKKYVNTIFRIKIGAFRNICSKNFSPTFYPYYFFYQLTNAFRHLPMNRKALNFFVRLTQMSKERIDSDEIQSIFDYEWDNLIILDACRQDLFEEVTGVKGFRYTPASGTGGYITHNFSSGDYSDIVYVTANPQFYGPTFKYQCGRELDNVFCTVFQSYKRSDTSHNPENVVRDTKTAESLFPEKRKIVHFLLPHMPAVREEHGHINWRDAERNEISNDEIWEIYKENLKHVLKHVKELEDELSGKTIVTSDHGNVFDSNGVYGHFGGIPIEGLRKVPLCDIKDLG